MHLVVLEMAGLARDDGLSVLSQPWHFDRLGGREGVRRRRVPAKGGRGGRLLPGRGSFFRLLWLR